MPKTIQLPPMDSLLLDDMRRMNSGIGIKRTERKSNERKSAMSIPYRDEHIKSLKQEAAFSLKSYRAMTSNYDCGDALVQYICPAAYGYAQAYDKAMLALKEIDPTFPKDFTKLAVGK